MNKEIFIKTILIATGLFTALAGSVAINPAQATQLYGISLVDPNIELLVRHRAVMLALLGSGLVYSAFSQPVRSAMIVGAIISKGLFLLLLQLQPVNAAFNNVVIFDGSAIVLLIITLILARSVKTSK